MTTVFLIYAEIGDGEFDYAVHQTQAGAEAGLRTMLCNQLRINPTTVANLSLDELQDEFEEETDGNRYGVKQITLLP